MRYILSLLLIMIFGGVCGQNFSNLKITGTSISYGDTLSEALVMVYDSQGRLIKSYDNRYYILLEFKYDEKGRIAEKSFLYGESFGNGSTVFKYFDNYYTETTFAAGFYIQKQVRLPDSSEINEVFFGNFSDTYILSKTIRFFDSEKRIVKEQITRIHKKADSTVIECDLEDEPCILKAFENMQCVDTVHTTITYEYKNNKLSKYHENDKLTDKKIFYKYNNSGFRVSEEIFEFDTLTYSQKLVYNSKNKLVEKIDTYITNSGDLNSGFLHLKREIVMKYFYDFRGNLKRTYEISGENETREYFKKNLPVKKEFFENGKLFELILFDIEYLK